MNELFSRFSGAAAMAITWSNFRGQRPRLQLWPEFRGQRPRLQLLPGPAAAGGCRGATDDLPFPVGAAAAETGHWV
jgi:hypothetical protein